MLRSVTMYYIKKDWIDWIMQYIKQIYFVEDRKFYVKWMKWKVVMFLNLPARNYIACWNCSVWWRPLCKHSSDIKCQRYMYLYVVHTLYSTFLNQWICHTAMHDSGCCKIIARSIVHEKKTFTIGLLSSDNWGL